MIFDIDVEQLMRKPIVALLFNIAISANAYCMLTH